MQVEFQKAEGGNFEYLAWDLSGDDGDVVGIDIGMDDSKAIPDAFIQAGKDVIAGIQADTENDENIREAAEDFLLPYSTLDGGYDFPDYMWEKVNFLFYS